jgi:hypothetical protein
MRKFLVVSLLLTFVTGALFANGINEDKKKSEEIKRLMWNSDDKDFAVTKTPDKWKNQSAIIIAKSNFLSYRKTLLLSSLDHDNYDHFRIKLLDNKAIERYAQQSIPGSGRYGDTDYKFYAGYKIIKPDGREIEISLDQAVKESRELNNRGFDVYKLAIPNLEVGDILDYYIAEEQTIMIYKYYSFNPIIFQLHEEYPVMKRKIMFDVLRKCYINLKSLNGAPEFELTEDAAREKSHYSLEDSDRESSKDVQWLFPYRELPAIKFRITYATGMLAAMIPNFIGSPGVLKSSVSKEEVEKLLASAFSNYMTSFPELKAYMKKQYKDVKDNNILAREAFYVLRNINRVKWAETRLLDSEDADPERSVIYDITALSNYYRLKKIDHEVIIGIPRQISSLDNLLLENELTFMIKVNTSKPFYLGRFTNNGMVGEVDPDLQGETVYSANGLVPPISWKIKKIEIPVISHEVNATESNYKVKIVDLSEGTIEVDLVKSFSGASRIGSQNALLDFYHYQDEETTKFKVNTSYPPVLTKAETKSRVNKKSDYMASRDENYGKTLKNILEDDFDLTIEEPTDFKIIQTGRFDDKPEFKYSCKVPMKGAVKKAGANYLIDVGKLIEEQVQIMDEDKVRNYNIYMPFARSFRYTVEVEIPEGYSIQGAEKLNVAVENAAGGFKGSARIESNKLIVEAYKYYKSNYEKKEKWSLITDFLQAAYDFTQKQVLLQKER